MVRVTGRRKKAPSLRTTLRQAGRRLLSKSLLGDAEVAGGSRQFPYNETQSILIQSARKLFAKKGFDGVSVKDVADASSLNISLISYHFNGKEGLYKACLEGFGNDTLEDVRRVLQPAKSFQECEWRLGMFIDLMLDIFVKQPDASRMVFKECDVEAVDIEDLFQSAFLEVFKSIVKFFLDAQKSGFINKDMDPHTVSAIFFGSLSHFARMDSISGKFFGRTITVPKDRQKVADHLKKIFASSLEAKIKL